MFRSRLPENFPFRFYFSKNGWKFKNGRFLSKKVKPLHKNWPSADGKTFSTKFLLDVKEQNNA